MYYWTTNVLHDDVQKHLEFNLAPVSLYISGHENIVTWSEFEFFRSSPDELYDSSIRYFASLLIDNSHIKRALGEYRLIGIDSDLEYDEDTFDINWQWIEENVFKD